MLEIVTNLSGEMTYIVDTDAKQVINPKDIKLSMEDILKVVDESYGLCLDEDDRLVFIQHLVDHYVLQKESEESNG